MPIMKKLKNVFSQQAGFTLIETLLSVVVTMFIVLMIPMIIFSYGTFKNVMDVEVDYEWNLFLHSLAGDLEDATRVIVFKDSFYIEYSEIPNSGTYIGYEKYGSKIRRTRNKQGNELSLQKIEQFTPTLNGKVFTLNVKFQNGISDFVTFNIERMDKVEENE